MEMGDTEKVVTIDLASSVELSSSLLEQLGRAFTELETCKVAPSDQVQWNDVEAHFHNVTSVMKKKLEQLEAKQKEFAERESHNRLLLDEREATVVSKEQDLLDRVQELKDVAVAAITKARADQIPELVNGVDAHGTKVSSFVDDENASLDTQDGKSPQRGNVEGVAFEVDPHTELTHFCEQMDSIGLVKFVMKNLKNVSSFWKEKLSVALGSVTEPARLVLNALEGFFPPMELTPERDNRDAALVGVRQSCIILMEALSAFLLKADCGPDNLLNSEIQQQAKSIANAWKLNLTADSSTAANGNSLEAEGYLRLLATFRIASEFDEEELCKYVLLVAHHWQAIELCRSLDLTQKIPGFVETLIERGKNIDAVHFIYAFQLSEAFPPVPLLKTYLRELRRNSQGNGSVALQCDLNARELEALRAIIRCVNEYKLQAEYSLEPLHKRVAQLDKSVRSDTKRSAETNKRQQQKRPRSDGGPRGSQGRSRDGGGGRGLVGGRHVQGRPSFSERAAYTTGLPERCIPAVSSAYSNPVIPERAAYTTGLSERYFPAVTSAYSNPVILVPAQIPNTGQTNDQRLSYYPQPQDTRPRGPYYPAYPTYGTGTGTGTYSHSSHQPFTQ